MPQATLHDIGARFTISIPAPEDRRTIAHIINRYGTSKTGAVRIALREYARAHALPRPVDEPKADQS